MVLVSRHLVQNHSNLFWTLQISFMILFQRWLCSKGSRLPHNLLSYPERPVTPHLYATSRHNRELLHFIEAHKEALLNLWFCHVRHTLSHCAGLHSLLPWLFCCGRRPVVSAIDAALVQKLQSIGPKCNLLQWVAKICRKIQFKIVTSFVLAEIYELCRTGIVRACLYNCI